MQKFASYFQKSESSQKTEAGKIEENSRHLGPIIARAAKIASGTNNGCSDRLGALRTRLRGTATWRAAKRLQILAPDPIIAKGIEARL